jgi:CelD/BcsL family acetyltransferase involved in cellulose biosynthesis
MTVHSVPAPPVTEAYRHLGIRNVPLNFQVGELRLFAVRSKLAVLECKHAPPFESLPPLNGADGYMLKGIEAPVDAALLARRNGWLNRILREYPRHLVDLTTTYEEYLAKFSGKTRSTLKRKLRKFQDLSGGKIDWREYRTPEEISVFWPLAQDLSARTYQERLLDAGLPRSDEFKKTALQLAADGTLRAYLLFLDGRAVSYLYLPIDGDCVIYAYLGYDPAIADHSPGTVLQLLAMERLFAEPSVTLFDFTEGAGHHKQLFSTHMRQCADVIIQRRTMSLVLLTAAHIAFERVERMGSRTLEAMGLKRQVKRLLRAFVSAPD